MKNNIILNILACGLVLSSPLLAFSYSNNTTKQQTNWKPFTSTKSNFTIDFPGEPEHIEQTIEIPKTDLSIAYHTFISEPNENMVYVVSVWDYPSEIDMSKPELNLQDGFGGMLSALPGSEVLSMNMGETNGFKSLEFLVKNEDIYFQGKLILVNNTLYQVFTVYKSDEQKNVDYDHFIGSFKLLKADKVPVKKAKRMSV